MGERMIDTGLTRLQFFARMRKEGFGRASMDLTAGATTYRRGRCMVAIGPGGDPDTVIVTGGPKTWPKILRWEALETSAIDLGMVNLLDLTLALIRGQIQIGNEQS